jgi:hypothetical protein
MPGQQLETLKLLKISYSNRYRRLEYLGSIIEKQLPWPIVEDNGSVVVK